VQLDIEVWLRGDDFATNQIVDVPVAEPAGWSDDDVRLLLEALLRAVDRARHPEAAADRPVALRGFNWIVNPFENGVLVSIEIQLGAAAAGPFAVDQAHLESMITRVLSRAGAPPSSTVH
jgi:hypothetical protein